MRRREEHARAYTRYRLQDSPLARAPSPCIVFSASSAGYLPIHIPNIAERKNREGHEALQRGALSSMKTLCPEPFLRLRSFDRILLRIIRVCEGNYYNWSSVFTSIKELEGSNTIIGLTF